MIVVDALLLAVCLTVAAIASDRAVSQARSLAVTLGATPFVIGVALIAVGTDLPEIANSISAHLQGNGDINVGDSVGSALTQYTLVLGILGLVAARIPVNRGEMFTIGILTAVSLGVLLWFVGDDWFARWEGAVLIGIWAVSLWVIVRRQPPQPRDDPEPSGGSRHIGALSTQILVLLAVVGVSATIAVQALIRIGASADVPEFLIAYFGAALGTSAPELVVAIAALRHGAHTLALGDAVGSSFVDSTLSVGIGALVAPAAVTARLATPGILYAILATVITVLLLATRRRHDRTSAVVLLAVYAVAYVVVISADI